MAAIESIWFSFIFLVMIWCWTGKISLPKKINSQHRNTKIVKLGFQMTKLKVSGEIFSRLGNVTKLKD